MNRTVTVLCPYCGMKNTVRIQEDFRQKSIATCDMVEGGCDKDFVVDAFVSIETKVLKIEGEEGKR